MMAVWGFLGLLGFCSFGFFLNQVFIKINWKLKVKIHGIGIIKCR